MASESEVEDLDVAVLRQENVFGFDVPVDDPLFVSRGEPVGDVAGNVEGPARRHRAVGHRHPERLALEQLADGVADALRFADVEESEDVGM